MTTKRSGDSAERRIDVLDSEDVEDLSNFESRNGGLQLSSELGLFALILRIVRRKRFMLASAMLLAGGFAFFLYHQGYLVPENLIAYLRTHPAMAPLIFVGVYALMVMLLLPTLPLNLGAGYLWGPYLGWTYSMLGAMVGASLAFLIARYLVRDYLDAKFNHRAWRWLQNEITASGWKAVAFARISPLFPFGPVNFFFGTTALPFSSYMVSTVAFISPPALAISYIGHSIGGYATTGEAHHLIEGLVLTSAAISLILFARYIIRKVMSRQRI